MSSDPINERTSEPGQGVTYSGTGWAQRPFEYTLSAVRKDNYVKRSYSPDGDGAKPTFYWHASAGHTINVNDYEERINSYLYTTRAVGVDAHRYLFSDNSLECINIHRSSPLSFPDTSQVDQALLNKLAESAVSIGNILAELTETVSYVTSRTRDIVNIARLIQTGKFSSAARKLGITKKTWRRHYQPQTVASRWLELNFAIRPLVKDIDDMIQLYQDPGAVVKRFAFQAQATLPLIEEGSFEYDRVGYDKYTVKSTAKGIIRNSCVYSISNVDQVVKKALGVNSPAASLYEVIPYSWLVAYVFSIDDFLNTLGATEGLSFHHGYRMIRVNAQSEYTQSYEYQLNAGLCYKRSTGVQWQSGYLRIPYTGFPTPTIQFVLPEITGKQISYVGSLAILLMNGARLRLP